MPSRRFKVYGRLEGGKAEPVTHGSQDVVLAYVQTEQGRIELQVNHLGSFTVSFAPVRNTHGNQFEAGSRQQLLKGNVNDLSVLMGDDVYLTCPGCSGTGRRGGDPDAPKHSCAGCDGDEVFAGEELGVKAHWQSIPRAERVLPEPTTPATPEPVTPATLVSCALCRGKGWVWFEDDSVGVCPKCQNPSGKTPSAAQLMAAVEVVTCDECEGSGICGPQHVLGALPCERCDGAGVLSASEEGA